MLIEPGIEIVWFSITSTGPKRRSKFAISVWACAFKLGKLAEYPAVPNPKFFGCGVFVATAEPTIVATTATTMRARIRNC